MVRRGYDLVSRAYRSDNAEEGAYGQWLDLLEARISAGSHVLDLGCGCGVPVARRLATRHQVTGIDLSPVQIERARELVPGAEFICGDMTTVEFKERSFDAVVCLFALIHIPLDEQPALLRKIHGWLRPGGVLLATVGHQAWTGVAENWLGVPGGDMWWSHADAATYRQWLVDAHLHIDEERFVPEDKGGHTLVLAHRGAEGAAGIAG